MLATSIVTTSVSGPMPIRLVGGESPCLKQSSSSPQFPSDGDADALARSLVSERLAACVNILPPMQSIYRWEGAVETASERQLIIKTEESQLESLKKRLTALHPYDVPEMLVLAVADGGVSYSAVDLGLGRIVAAPRHPRHLATRAPDPGPP